jgi:hypothetical protein
MQVLKRGSDARMTLKFTDNSEEALDLSNMHSGQVLDYIWNRVEEKDMQTVLSQHKFVGKKLTSHWGL